MPKIRVLIVDDAVVVRKIVSEMLALDDAIEVVGTAPNGRVALLKIPQCNPDIITLDYEMPEMDGLATLRAIRSEYPNLPVIMFSTLTERGAAVTLDALSAGASDYVTKPANVGNVVASRKAVSEELRAKIKALVPSKAPQPPSAPAVPPPRPVPLPTRPAPSKFPRSTRSRVEIVAIGVSTGGPNALGTLLPKLPADFPAPVLIVQHMPKMFTKLLAERLDTQCQLRCEEGVAGGVVERGKIYIAPGDYHMEVRESSGRAEIFLHQGPPENSCRPAVDVLFRSAVNVYGDRTLGVILTGMGQDGLRGCEYIREAGGEIIAQDEASSVVWGMPGAVVRNGLADIVLPLEEIAGEIISRTLRGGGRRASAGMAIGH